MTTPKTPRVGRPKKGEAREKAHKTALLRLTAAERDDLALVASAMGLSISRAAAAVFSTLAGQIRAKQDAAEKAEADRLAQIEAQAKGDEALRKALTEHTAWQSGDALVEVTGGKVKAHNVDYIAQIVGPHPEYHLDRRWLGERGADPRVTDMAKSGMIVEIKASGSRSWLAVNDGLVCPVDHAEVKRAAKAGLAGLAELARRSAKPPVTVSQVVADDFDFDDLLA